MRKRKKTKKYPPTIYFFYCGTHNNWKAKKECFSSLKFMNEKKIRLFSFVSTLFSCIFFTSCDQTFRSEDYVENHRARFIVSILFYFILRKISKTYTKFKYISRKIKKREKRWRKITRGDGDGSSDRTAIIEFSPLLLLKRNKHFFGRMSIRIGR